MFDAIQQARERGIPVVISTRVPTGRVFPLGAGKGLALALKRIGCVLADDLSPQKARILPMLALTKTNDPVLCRSISTTKRRACQPDATIDAFTTQVMAPAHAVGQSSTDAELHKPTHLSGYWLRGAVNALRGPVRTRLSKDCGSPRRAPEGTPAFSLPRGRNRPLINILTVP